MRNIGPIVIIALVISIILAVILSHECFRKNNDQDWQVCQSLSGTVTIVDNPGWYPIFFATIWTYPKFQEAVFDADDNSFIDVTFNDGGNAKMGAHVLYKLPTDINKRRELHRQFSGNSENIKDAVRSALINVMKSTAPIMTATENMSSRKGEFTQLVQDQLQYGLYSYEIKAEVNHMSKAADGSPVKVYRSEIIRDAKGKPQIAQESPLRGYGIDVVQFSITETKYDEQTTKQFAAKKDSLLNAEKFKADKDAADQEALMIRAKGLKDAAKQEADSNVVATKQRIDAEVKVTVALQEKLQAETVAAQKVSVAQQEKLEAEVRANREKTVAEIDAQKQLEVSKLRLQAAKAEAEAIETLATATQKQIQLAGIITEKEKVLATISADRDVRVAESLAKIAVPTTVITGSGATGSNDKAAMQDSLMSLYLLKNLDVLKHPELRPIK